MSVSWASTEEWEVGGLRPVAAGYDLDRSPSSIPARLHAALLALLESFNYAEDVGRDCWDFALEFPSLLQLGLSPNDCRWLIGRSLVTRAEEIASELGGSRRFVSCVSPLFCDRTCFVLTADGVKLARKIARIESAPIMEAGQGLVLSGMPLVAEAYLQPATMPMPQWDEDRRELRVGDQVVKVFRVPAPNQETILAAFEEDRWLPRIDDPLPGNSKLCPKRRLHDAITALNRHQRQRLIRFLADGHGRGVRWEFIEKGSAAAPAPHSVGN